MGPLADEVTLELGDRPGDVEYERVPLPQIAEDQLQSRVIGFCATRRPLVGLAAAGRIQRGDSKVQRLSPGRGPA